MGSKLAEFNDDNFEEEVVKSSVPVMVDFYAEWCGPCKMMVPALESVGQQMGDSVKVGKVNIETSSSLTSKYGVKNVPTVLVFKDGEVVGRKIGSQTEASLKKLLSGDE